MIAGMNRKDCIFGFLDIIFAYYLLGYSVTVYDNEGSSVDWYLHVALC